MCVQLAEKVYIAYTAQGTKCYFILHYERMNREEEEPTVALATEKSFRFFSQPIRTFSASFERNLCIVAIFRHFVYLSARLHYTS